MCGLIVVGILMIDYEAMKEVLAIPDESGAFFKWHSTEQLEDALYVGLPDGPLYRRKCGFGHDEDCHPFYVQVWPEVGNDD